MFCDLVGSTPLSNRLDPEDLRELLREYQDAATRAVRDYGGHIAEYLGDGLVVYFGYPVAHEDDAERAVRAGLGIVASLTELNAEVQRRWDTRVEVRVGVHTGVVVVGEIGGRDVHGVIRTVGETPNIAARVQGEAPVDGVAVTGQTRQLVRGPIDFEPMGPRDLKGVGPIPLFRVVGEHRWLAASDGDVEIVDRVAALDALRASWSEVLGGGGRVARISGGPGIGKSKLVAALRRVCLADGASWFHTACLPYRGSSALHPLVAVLEDGLGITEDLALDARRDRVRQSLGALDLLEHEAAACQVLGLPGGPGRQGAAPATVRRRTYEALLAIIAGLRAGRPGVLVVEDAHWADPSTLELLALVTDTPPPGLYMVVTHREPHEVSDASVSIELGPLDPADVTTLVNRVGGADLPPSVRDHIAARTDGVPLFIGELTRMLMNRGSSEEIPLVSLTQTPTGLRDSLMARIDGLGRAKPLAQLASVIGRVFGYDLLAAIIEGETSDLDRDLHKLVASGVVGPVDGGPAAAFAFSHALVRDVAYESMLRQTRRDHHARIARVLIERFEDTAALQPELVAHHFTEADQPSQAFGYWRLAARAALGRSATAEAVSDLRRALEALPSLSAGEDRDREELAVYSTLGGALASSMGYGDEEVERTFGRAHALAAGVGAAPELFPVLFGLVAFFTARGDFGTARTLGEQLLASASGPDADGLRIEAHFSLGMVDLYVGEVGSGLAHLESGLSLYDPARHHQLAQAYVFDPGVACHRAAGMALCLLGRHEEGLAESDAAVDLAERLDHPFSLASALVFAALVHQLRGDRAATRTVAEEAIAVADRHSYPFWALNGRILRGWAIGGVVGYGELAPALDQYRHTGTLVFVPYGLALRAELEAEAGMVEQAPITIGEALAVVARTGERWYEPRLRELAVTTSRLEGSARGPG